ncbi:unnamed protein product [Enterobius vermicularis]|uniref:Outer membrane protein n=1 Tax=Enterobius vermicularis TaxID=51028 RepID=A0A0N4VJX0_ENTVE|nr:unnamed protein product [Enterobius vermicularis]
MSISCLLYMLLNHSFTNAQILPINLWEYSPFKTLSSHSVFYGYYYNGEYQDIDIDNELGYTPLSPSSSAHFSVDWKTNRLSGQTNSEESDKDDTDNDIHWIDERMNLMFTQIRFMKPGTQICIAVYLVI